MLNEIGKVISLNNAKKTLRLCAFAFSILFFNFCGYSSSFNKVFLEFDKSFSQIVDWDGLALSGDCEFALDNDLNLYLLDKKAKSIFCFSENGKFKFKFGRKGQGPGEFQYPNYIFILENKYVCVYELTSKSILMFDKKGILKQMLKLKRNIRGVAPLNNNSLAILEQGKNSIQLDDIFEDNLKIVKIETKETKDVCSVKKENNYWIINYDGGGFSFFGKEYGEFVFLKQNRKGDFYLAKSKSNNVDIFNKSGKKIKSFKLNKNITQFSSQQKTEQIKKIQKFLKKQKWKMKEEKLRKGLDSIPIFQQVFIDEFDNLLFLNFKSFWEKGKNFSYDKYSKNGKFLGSYELIFEDKKWAEKINNLYGYDITWEFKNNYLYIFLENNDNEEEPYFEVLRFEVKNGDFNTKS